MKTSVLASLAMALSTAMAAPFPIDNARVDHSEGPVSKRQEGLPSPFDLPQGINPGQTSDLGSARAADAPVLEGNGRGLSSGRTSGSITRHGDTGSGGNSGIHVPGLDGRPTQWRDDVPDRADSTHTLDVAHAPTAERDGKGSARGSAKNLLPLGEDGPLGRDAHKGADQASESVADKDGEDPFGNSHLLQEGSLRHADPERANDREADPATKGVADKERKGSLGNSHLLPGGSLGHADLEHANDRGADRGSEGVADKDSEGPLGSSHLLQRGGLNQGDLERVTKDE